MREMKCRAWDREKKQMFHLDVFTLLLDSGNTWSFWDAFCDSDMARTFKENRMVTNYKTAILMWYTGLKDKSGVEIYEGDIIKAPFEDLSEYKEIVFNCGCWRFKRDNIIRGYLWDFDIIDLEVIGNIYENKELLNE